MKTRVLGFEPDRVVYVMCLNDFDQTDSSAEKIRYFRRPRASSSRTSGVLYRRARGIEFHRYHFERNRKAAFADVLAMKQAVAARPASFLLVVLPVFFEGTHDFAGYPLRDIHAAVMAFCAANGIEAFDLLPAFERSGRGRGEGRARPLASLAAGPRARRPGAGAARRPAAEWRA